MLSLSLMKEGPNFTRFKCSIPPRQSTDPYKDSLRNQTKTSCKRIPHKGSYPDKAITFSYPTLSEGLNRLKL